MSLLIKGVSIRLFAGLVGLRHVWLCLPWSLLLKLSSSSSHLSALKLQSLQSILSFKMQGLVCLLLSLIDSTAKTFGENTSNLILCLSPPLVPVEVLDLSHSSFELGVPAILETIGEARNQMTSSL